MEFAIVDIETTGGDIRSGGITEIAVLIHNGIEITETFQTLLNPRQTIPTYITGLTGIDSEMVRNAPFFEEIAEEVWGLLEGRVFVAHQVNFDFGFLKTAFSSLGKDLVNPKLCTVRLARKIFPGLNSYSLGRICEAKKIPIEARHRAMGDAKATAILFDQMLKLQPDAVMGMLGPKNSLRFLPPNFPSHKFSDLPKSCGVYYMLDSHGKIIYVGKAINIQERFRSHFSGNLHFPQKQELKAAVADLKWELTGSEFMALLLETLEIKRLWPKYNQAIKKPKALWGLYSYLDGNGYTRFQLARLKKNLQPVETFFSQEEGRGFLKEAAQSFNLCQRLSGLRSVTCGSVMDESCEGACEGNISPKKYNEKIQRFLKSIQDRKGVVKIELEGRNENEKAVCVFEKGILIQYGFKILNEKEDSFTLKSVSPYPETAYIFKQFFHQFSPEQIEIIDRIEQKPREVLPLGF
ncbi:DNA polymerase III subunit epsilon [Algoriphagus kandeliae]|uniref:DNA polymerase III subunit epsilon n=1 Tax=Algoriphagus kandeliae TaxID=2562278 RepID=A0A4Y9QZ47_9BACT|nr:exonuclease domain-containing protein [Algoriphagus kandeliae]TFV97340.1 DNA polymerase III subunit epsilon [Algoriphagus kandeliae]